jgi:hypothetical protein
VRIQQSFLKSALTITIKMCRLQLLIDNENKLCDHFEFTSKTIRSTYEKDSLLVVGANPYALARDTILC